MILKMRFTIVTFFGLMANIAVVANGLELTVDTYDVMTEGKTVFLKFFAPWCGHCKNMKPDWDKLMEEFGSSDTQLVADVDCTSDGGKPLCDAIGVRGFPTLKFGDPSSLDEYEGGRDFDSLKKFADDNLKPMCSPSNIDLCDDDSKVEIEKFLALGVDVLEKQINEKQSELDATEEEFMAFVNTLQEQYQNKMDEKDAKIEEIKKVGNLTMMQKCLGSLKKKEKQSGGDEL